MKNGEEHPYLLRAKAGKGLVVLTSSDLGYVGGWEMFGRQHSVNAANLIENLLEAPLPPL